jgi:glycopeptide antibiotics resistance protein
LAFEKSNHKLKSIAFGISLAFFIGLAKEYIDPLLGGDKDKFDLIYTVLGSLAGAVLFLGYTSLKKKKSSAIQAQK